ncbi:MAG: hypothetical protein ACOZAO_00310 [Patescibacteria group bacterium]
MSKKDTLTGQGNGQQKKYNNVYVDGVKLPTALFGPKRLNYGDSVTYDGDTFWVRFTDRRSLQLQSYKGPVQLHTRSSNGYSQYSVQVGGSGGAQTVYGMAHISKGELVHLCGKTYTVKSSRHGKLVLA